MYPEVLDIDFQNTETYVPEGLEEWYILFPIRRSDGLFGAMYWASADETVELPILSTTAKGVVLKMKAHLQDAADYALANNKAICTMLF